MSLKLRLLFLLSSILFSFGSKCLNKSCSIQDLANSIEDELTKRIL